MSLPSVPSERTLDGLPPRVLRFLHAVGRASTLRAALAPYGLTSEVIKEGWDRLLAVSGYHQAVPASSSDAEGAAALALLDAWDDRWFPVAEIVARLHFPAQHGFLFGGGLAATSGPASALAVATFVQRLDALESGAGRPPEAAEADRACRARLAARGLTAAEVDRARAALATYAQPPEGVAEVDNQAARLALWAWFAEWSTVARMAISRRDYLVRLGLARPRRRARDTDPAGAMEDTDGDDLSDEADHPAGAPSHDSPAQA